MTNNLIPNSDYGYRFDANGSNIYDRDPLGLRNTIAALEGPTLETEAKIVIRLWMLGNSKKL